MNYSVHIYELLVTSVYLLCVSYIIDTEPTRLLPIVENVNKVKTTYSYFSLFYFVKCILLLQNIVLRISK
jgi:hypothetical protein